MKVLIINTNRHNQPFPVMPLGACMGGGKLRTCRPPSSMLDFHVRADPFSALRSNLTDNHFRGRLSIRNIDNNVCAAPSFFRKTFLILYETYGNILEAKNRKLVGLPSGSCLKNTALFQRPTMPSSADGDMFCHKTSL